eukprot:326675-Chlamydomonas_euryale.AAC.4
MPSTSTWSSVVRCATRRQPRVHARLPLPSLGVLASTGAPDPKRPEDEKLRRLVEQHGPKKWSVIASLLGSKGSKQVRGVECGAEPRERSAVEGRRRAAVGLTQHCNTALLAPRAPPLNLPTLDSSRPRCPAPSSRVVSLPCLCAVPPAMEEFSERGPEEGWLDAGGGRERWRPRAGVAGRSSSSYRLHAMPCRHGGLRGRLRSMHMQPSQRLWLHAWLCRLGWSVG